MGGAPRVLILVLTVLMGAGGVGCGLLRGKAKAGDDGFVEDMRRGRRPMGQVMMVNAEKGFVLVRSPLAGVVPVDGTLVVKEQGTATTTGRIKVTPERDKNRLAADITEGVPKVGDIVFFETQEKVVSTVPPPGDQGAGSEPAGVAGAAGAAGLMLPEAIPPLEQGGGRAAELPPLGEPSGPREVIPDFPGLDPVPSGGGAAGPDGGLEELPEPSAPDA
jgi:hypothetical protein